MHWFRRYRDILSKYSLLVSNLLFSIWTVPKITRIFREDREGNEQARAHWGGVPGNTVFFDPSAVGEDVYFVNLHSGAHLCFRALFCILYFTIKTVKESSIDLKDRELIVNLDSFIWRNNQFVIRQGTKWLCT